MITPADPADQLVASGELLQMSLYAAILGLLTISHVLGMRYGAEMLHVHTGPAEADVVKL